METIQIVPDTDHPIGDDQGTREQRDRAVYRKNPPVLEEAQGWEREAAWPDRPDNL